MKLGFAAALIAFAALAVIGRTTTHHEKKIQPDIYFENVCV